MINTKTERRGEGPSCCSTSTTTYYSPRLQL